MFFHGIMTFVMILGILFGAYYVFIKWIAGSPVDKDKNSILEEKRARLREATQELQDKQAEVDATLNLKAIEEEIELLKEQIEVLENA